MDILEIYFSSLIFLSNMFSSYFFQNNGDDSPMGLFAQMYFSVIISTFSLKEGTKNPILLKDLYLLLNI